MTEYIRKREGDSEDGRGSVLKEVSTSVLSDRVTASQMLIFKLKLDKSSVSQITLATFQVIISYHVATGCNT